MFREWKSLSSLSAENHIKYPKYKRYAVFQSHGIAGGMLDFVAAFEFEEDADIYCEQHPGYHVEDMKNYLTKRSPALFKKKKR